MKRQNEASDNRVFNTIAHTVGKYAILVAFIFALDTRCKSQDARQDSIQTLIANSQKLIAKSQKPKVNVLLPGKSVTAQVDTLVYMNLPVFHGYYLARKQVDSLMVAWPAYLITNDSLIATLHRTIANYAELSANHDAIIAAQAAQLGIREKQIVMIKKKLKRTRTLAGAMTAPTTAIILILLL